MTRAGLDSAARCRRVLPHPRHRPPRLAPLLPRPGRTRVGRGRRAHPHQGRPRPGDPAARNRRDARTRAVDPAAARRRRDPRRRRLPRRTRGAGLPRGPRRRAHHPARRVVGRRGRRQRSRSLQAARALPPRSSTGRHPGVAADVLAECRRIGIPLVLEPLFFGLASPADRPAVVLRTVERFAALAPDLLKLPFPVDADTTPNRDTWAERCDEVTARCPMPWALLSGGGSFESFADQVEVALAHGCRGLHGRPRPVGRGRPGRRRQPTERHRPDRDPALAPARHDRHAGHTMDRFTMKTFTMQLSTMQRSCA